MSYRIDAIPAFKDNYIWCISHTGSGAALVVDPGDAAPVTRFLERNNLTLEVILLTHHHPDHSNGIKSLLATGDVPVYGPADSPYKGVTEQVAEGDSLSWRDWSFSVLAVPGHTLDHIAFVASETPLERPVAFCGDALFACGCGRIFEGKPDQMRRSLEKLRALPGDTLLYCGHEYTLANVAFARAVRPDSAPLRDYEDECQSLRDAGKATLPTVLHRELELNPFLQWDSKEVASAAEGFAREAGRQLDPSDPDQVFATIRQWKDSF